MNSLFLFFTLKSRRKQNQMFVLSKFKCSYPFVNWEIKHYIVCHLFGTLNKHDNSLNERHEGITLNAIFGICFAKGHVLI